MLTPKKRHCGVKSSPLPDLESESEPVSARDPSPAPEVRSGDRGHGQGLHPFPLRRVDNRSLTVGQQFCHLLTHGRYAEDGCVEGHNVGCPLGCRDG